MRTSHAKLDALDHYANAFRDLVNDRVAWKSASSPAKLLRLSSEGDWNFVCVAMDILGDSTWALQNFARFGLDGPTRHEDTGECYLRLYGLLSAAYVQQQAALKLYKLMNCPHPKLRKEQLNGLQLRQLRHQLASHSLDYNEFDGGSDRAFVPVRIELGGHRCTVTESRGDSFITYDLRSALNQHCDAMVDLLDAVYEKSHRTLFKSESTQIKKYEHMLEELRLIKGGAMVIKIAPAEGEEGGVERILVVPMKSARREDN